MAVVGSHSRCCWSTKAHGVVAGRPLGQAWTRSIPPERVLLCRHGSLVSGVDPLPGWHLRRRLMAATSIIVVGDGHRRLWVGEAAAATIVVGRQEPVGDAEVCPVHCLKHVKEKRAAHEPYFKASKAKNFFPPTRFLKRAPTITPAYISDHPHLVCMDIPEAVFSPCWDSASTGVWAQLGTSSTAL